MIFLMMEACMMILNSNHWKTSYHWCRKGEPRYLHQYGRWRWLHLLQLLLLHVCLWCCRECLIVNRGLILFLFLCSVFRLCFSLHSCFFLLDIKEVSLIFSFNIFQMLCPQGAPFWYELPCPSNMHTLAPQIPAKLLAAPGENLAYLVSLDLLLLFLLKCLKEFP